MLIDIRFLRLSDWIFGGEFVCSLGLGIGS